MRRLFRKQLRVEQEQSEITPEEIFPDAVNAPGFRQEMQEGRLERPIHRRSFILFGALLSLGFAVIIARLFQLEVIRGDAFFAQSQANKTYPIVIEAPRGIFYDRNLKELVENTPTFTISLNTAAFADDKAFADALARLAALVGKTVADIAEANGLSSGALPPETLARRDSWPGEIFIASGDLRTAVLEIQARPESFRGAIVAESEKRDYLLSSAAVHLLGYVGRPSREDLASRPGIRPTGTLGKTGLEFQYEQFLGGTAGEKLLEVNAAGEPVRERYIEKAEPGHDVVLEIDADLQRFAAETLARHIKALGKKAGAFVAVDPRNGAIRALVSYPSFDPNPFGGGFSQKEFERLAKDPGNPFFNRAISGGYPSGSTIKPILAVAALEEGTIEPTTTIYDPGYISVPNPYDALNPTIFKDWKALGLVDMRRALALSANVYFYTIGGGYGDIKGLGIERIERYLERFGWGRPSGIDLPSEYGGLIPDPEKKKTIRPKDPYWRIGNTYITAIGQGDLQVTPLQLALSTAAIANGGTLWKPRIARAVVDEEKQPIQEFPPVAVARDLARPESLDVVREGMRAAVTEGSATALRDLFFTSAGKTGTAQTGAYGKNHGWFTGFAPYENPEIAVAVLVEEGSGGTSDAVPIAKEILYYYFTHHE